jgi:hypothetical protein
VGLEYRRSLQRSSAYRLLLSFLRFSISSSTSSSLTFIAASFPLSTNALPACLKSSASAARRSLDFATWPGACFATSLAGFFAT